MAISNFNGDRKAETKAVREALAKVGIDARVGHGRGTAWGWLEVNVGAGQQFGEHEDPDRTLRCSSDCLRCHGLKALTDTAMRIVLEVTGRGGHGYNGWGDISLSTQDEWNQKKKCRVEITHPRFKVEGITAETIAAQRERTLRQVGAQFETLTMLAQVREALKGASHG